ncbi:iron ABC transporter permease [Glutamicibacter sp. MNS18]|uniref:FecCD family ABC transporter permease n=1 Tax=Glutamicibacter sp. MNS18 TaxID=2989817 RepID=UPI002235C6FD|nr:iron ABC transporter permease [Glutamicibacter sp. MNS18]MCW4465679.1 iron ABC transporter permease [Glutamicibacter sp. MNS18]
MGTTLHTPVGFTARAGAGVPLVVGLAVLGTAITASLFLGSQPVAPRQVLAYLFGDSASLPEATAAVLDLRVPRTILGLVCGAALGLAGALCQMHTRNPLADPGLLGVTSGAACGVVFALGVLRLSSPAQYTVFGLIGALLAGGLVLGLASGIKLTDAATSLVLAGAIVTGALNSVSSTVVLMDRVTMDRFRYWTVGSLSGRDTSVLWDVAPWLLLGLLLAIHNSSSLDALALGDDVAASLGRNVVRDRVTGLLAVVLLAGSATAAIGAIAFLGLAAPHLARRITRARLPVVAAVSALLGAALMLAADTVGRLVLASGELSVGIVLSVIGAPIFILLARSLKRGRGNAPR